MKLFDINQIRDWDIYTIENEPIASIDLMERAANAFTERIIKLIHEDDKVLVVCGGGNNGGDGLVVARLLFNKGYDVEVFVPSIFKKYSPDFEINFQRLKELKVPCLVSDNSIPNKDFKFIIDALFGSGLKREISGVLGELVEEINNSKSKVLSIDIPSGLFADDNSQNSLSKVVKANYTFTFQLPKLAFLLPNYAEFIGFWEVLNIGLHPDYYNRIQSSNYILSKGFVKHLLIDRDKFSHKGNYGHALIISGSKEMTGASVLCSEAALKSGAGLVTAFIDESSKDSFNTRCPEVMLKLKSEDSILPETKTFTSFSIGPGLGRSKESEKLLNVLLKQNISNLVLDADALNILADNPTWQSFLPVNTVLTPHPGEFKRLVGNWQSDEEKLKLASLFAIKNKVVLVLKGAHTSIHTPSGETYFNTTGNPGMATGGSGDVLTGLITGLLSQNYPAVYAAIIGVYIHGLSGDLLLNETESVESIIASKLSAYFGAAFNNIRNA